ncbi:MAG: hypothetical protein WCG94_05015 [Methanothrix sp.]
MTPEKCRSRKARTDLLRGKARRQAGKSYDRQAYDGNASASEES